MNTASLNLIIVFGYSEMTFGPADRNLTTELFKNLWKWSDEDTNTVFCIKKSFCSALSLSTPPLLTSNNSTTSDCCY